MKKAGTIAGNVLLLLMCCVWLFPVYIILTNSFKSQEEMYLFPSPLPLIFNIILGPFKRWISSMHSKIQASSPWGACLSLWCCAPWRPECWFGRAAG